MNNIKFKPYPKYKESGIEKKNRGRLLILSNSVTFSGQLMEPDEFLNQRVEALGITMDRRPKGRPCKMKS